MGGRRHTLRRRHRRPAVRRGALLGVLGALLGALLLCTRAGGGTEVMPTHAKAGLGGVAVDGSASAHSSYVCPGDLPGCSHFPHVAPGLVPVPPPAVLPPRAEPPPGAAAGPEGRIRLSRGPARAPDLHVLQVMRT
ncbi:hypothetical protein [Streptomyces sp. WAC06614]|uniref:hypothetical protein n=1 Tax=Streptomyces sp. WAC06614 TaxID=2487416 RepID=UPI000F78A9ED|nr:hypothetical protein [Streptomyces sp. WAC06614]RSS80537.1 hypothetical protein EF918_13315 [Streptomyces sp. WAC06614]